MLTLGGKKTCVEVLIFLQFGYKPKNFIELMLFDFPNGLTSAAFFTKDVDVVTVTLWMVAKDQS